MIYPQSASPDTRAGRLTAPGPASSSRDIRSKLPLARLPMMPQVLVRLLDLYHRDDVSLGAIAEVICRDAGMATKVISVASSASQHGRSRPANLEQCLNVLGMSAIKTIVINESIVQVFRGLTAGRDFDLRRFWEHSLRSALIARALAKAVGYANCEEAYLGGLLHDVGQLALLAADADAYSALFMDHENHEELCRKEQMTFELTHAEVGAWLVEKWELDSLLSDSVLYHHDPVERIVGAQMLIRIVFLADRLTTLKGGKPEKKDVELAGLCGITHVDLPLMLENTELELVDLAEQLGVELSRTPLAGADGRTATLDVAPADVCDLNERLRDMLLVERVLGNAEPSDTVDAALHNIAQAAKVLFSVHPALCFLANNNRLAQRNDQFSGHPLGNRFAKVAQLEFVRGQSSAEVARAIDHGPLIFSRSTSGTPPQNLLDEQLMRLIGGDGLLFIPLRSYRICHGVFVAGIENALQIELLGKRMSCFEHFGRMAGALLRQAMAPANNAGTRVNSSDEALRLHMRQVVHEASNPLSIIMNYLATLETKFAADGVGVRELGIVTEEITRVSKILQTALKDPSEMQSTVGALKLNALIQDLVALCRASSFVSSAVEIQTDLFADLPELWSDGDQLKQLLLNLLKNSIEALGTTAGIIRVSTAPWGIGPTHIEIRVQDSGPGIPAEVLDQLYQPVSSSKGQTHLGIGLAIVGQLVRDLNGLINCRSNDKGTSFQLLLPLVQE